MGVAPQGRLLVPPHLFLLTEKPWFIPPSPLTAADFSVTSIAHFRQYRQKLWQAALLKSKRHIVRGSSLLLYHRDLDCHALHRYGSPWKESEAEKNLLRTHTTAVSSRMLYRLAQEGFKPAKYFSIDRVFRNEAIDRTHLAEFHQIEGKPSMASVFMYDDLTLEGVSLSFVGHFLSCLT